MMKMIFASRRMVNRHQNILLPNYSVASFARKTTGPKKKQSPNGIEDEAFDPPTQKGTKSRTYIPEIPLVFNKEGSLLIFEVSQPIRRLPRMTVPSYLLTFVGALFMVDAFAM